MKKNLKNIFKSGFVLAAAFAGAIAVEGESFADSTVSGYSGKPHFADRATCFTPNAGWAHNSCTTHELWAMYPMTSTQLTNGGHVSLLVYSPSVLTSCRLDITDIYRGYAYQSGTKYAPALGSAEIEFKTPSPPLIALDAAEIVCDLAPGSEVTALTIVVP